jgi:hypothetical protein
MIRLPNIPNLQGSAINAPGVSARAVAAPAIALGNLAQGIANAGEAFHNTAVRLQKVENARLVSEKRQQLARSYAEHQASLQTDPDPSSRMQKTQAFLANAKGMMDDENLAPAARDELRQHFDGFATDAFIKQTAQSASLGLQRAAATFKNEVSLAEQNMDSAAGEAAIDQAGAAGVLLPEEVETAKRSLGQNITYNQRRAEIAKDPLAAEKAANAPDFAPELTPQQRAALQNEAEQQANRYRSDFTNDIIISGQSPTLEDLAAMEAAGQIDKSTHARWAVKIRSNVQPVHDPAIYEESFALISKYDPAQDPSGRVLAQIRNQIASQSLPDADVKTLNEKLNDRFNPATSAAPKAKLSSQFTEKIGTDFTRGDFGKYRFPIDHDNNPSTAPITPISKDDYDKAWKLRGEFSEQWRAALDALPDDASFDQINSAYEGLKKSFKDKKPLPELNFTKPSTLGFDPEKTYEKATGKTFGGQAIKAPGIPYTGAGATIFGGPNDPADNGKSAFGGATGPGGKEGVAIPQSLMAAKFPGRDKKWIEKNTRTVVRGPDGLYHVLPVVDYGTAEWVWNRAGRPTLDLTEGAVKALGGKPQYTGGGKLRGVSGLPSLDFAVVSIDTGTPLAGRSWEDVKTDWFKVNRPKSNVQIATSLIALREVWNTENAAVGDLVMRPGDKAELEKPVLRPGDDAELIKMNADIIDENTHIATEANN